MDSRAPACDGHGVPVPFPSPTVPAADRREVLLTYLDYYRAAVRDKVSALPEPDRRRPLVPSGWSARDLVVHLTAMERRWLVWGFAGEPVDDPWYDDGDEHWTSDDTATTGELLDRLDAGGARTRAIVRAHALDAVGAPGPRWDGAPPATLERVLLHVFQEYARHTGHLDVAVELAGGPTGE